MIVQKELFIEKEKFFIEGEFVIILSVIRKKMDLENIFQGSFTNNVGNWELREVEIHGILLSMASGLSYF